MASPLFFRFPVNKNGYAMLVGVSAAVAPFTYSNGLKIDANGCVVCLG